jgi:hypothetical protein
VRTDAFSTPFTADNNGQQQIDDQLPDKIAAAKIAMLAMSDDAH